MELSLYELTRQVRDHGDRAAAREIADRMLGRLDEPQSFTVFLARVPGMPGHMTPETFDLLADVYDEWAAQRSIRGLPEATQPKETS